MKISIKITAGALCLAALLGSAAGVSAAIAKAENMRATSEPALQSIDGFIGEERRMVVCVSQLAVYKTRNGDLLSDERASYKKGSEVTVKPISELIYEVRSNSMLVGYCYASGLVDKDTKLVAKLPYLWDVITVAIPVEKPVPEEPESGDNTTDGVTETPLPEEPEYTYEEKLVYTDLVDINEFAYRPGCSIAISEDTVFAQRELLTALTRLSLNGQSFCIVEGYKAEGLPSDCEIPSSSGAIVKLEVIGSDGKRAPVSSVNGLVSSLSAVGILRHGESDWFYFKDYGNYMTSDFSSLDYVYTIFE